MLPVNPARLPAMYQEARQHLAARRLPQAKSVLENILVVKPDLAEAHFTLAQVLVEMEQYEASLTHLERASDLKPGEQAIWTLYGKAIQKIADPSKSEAFLQKAKKARIDRRLLLDLQNALNPKPGKSKTSIGSAPAADVERAISLLQSDRPKEAVALARQLHSAHPDVSIIADILASSLASLGNEAEAERMFRKAITLDPNYPEARVNFGRFLLKLDRSEDAVKELRSALCRTCRRAFIISDWRSSGSFVSKLQSRCCRALSSWMARRCPHVSSSARRCCRTTNRNAS